MSEIFLANIINIIINTLYHMVRTQNVFLLLLVGCYKQRPLFVMFSLKENVILCSKNIIHAHANTMETYLSRILNEYNGITHNMQQQQQEYYCQRLIE